MARLVVPKETQDRVLLLSRRRCCICFGLHGDGEVKKGQIAHLDHGNTNNVLDNLAFLCLAHHDEYDGRTRQSKGMQESEVKHFRKELYDWTARLPRDETGEALMPLDEATPDPQAEYDGGPVGSQFSTPRSWTRDQKLVVAGVVVAIALGLGAFFVPEGRRFLGLDRRPQAAVQKPYSLQTSLPDVPGSRPSDASDPSEVMRGESAINIEELRRKHNVAAMRETESGESLSELPPGSFGYVFPESVVHVSPLDRLPLRTHGESFDFEIHKLTDDRSELAAYVGPETLDRIRQGLHHGEKLTMYTGAWKEAQNLVSIPVSRIECERTRDLMRYWVIAVDCRIN